MALKVPNEGEADLLRYVFKTQNVVEGIELRLYQNNYTPVDATTQTNFTEANFTNYSRKTLNLWLDPTTSGGKAVTQHDSVGWTCGSITNTIYGYYVVNTSSSKLLWTERFGSPVALSNTDTLSGQPSFTLSADSGPVVLVNTGENRFLEKIVTGIIGTNSFHMHLYSNNYTPTGTSLVGDFTEASFSGYVVHVLAPGSWLTPTTVNGKAVIENSTPVTWTCGSIGQVVYGYYVTDDSGLLLWAEKFSLPQVMTSGSVLSFLPKFAFHTES